MKKVLLGNLLLMLVLVFSSCTTENPSDLVRDEFIRLSELIPLEYDSDLELPRTRDSFELEYYIDDVLIEDYIVEYELLPENTEYLLKLVITYENVQESYYVRINQKGNQNLIEDEIARILYLIPNEFESNLTLPQARSGFEVVYSIDGVIIENNEIIYELLTEDKNITIALTVFYKEYSDDSEIVVKQIVNEELYYDMMFASLLHDISNLIPSSLVSNTSLPEVSNETADIVYSSDCTNIVRNRIVYNHPLITTQCNLVVTATFSDKTREDSIPFYMTALNDLPKIPAIYITTVDNQAITTKEEYVPGTLTLVIEGESSYSEIDDAVLGIKLRGNSTLFMPKKAFKINFEEKQSLLSDYAEKKWVLLANHVDQTLLRDYLAFSMASKLDMDFVPSYTFVDLYINGEYLGNYLLTDQIEVTNDRVNIEEKTSDIDTGFLVEYDIGLYREGLENSDENYFLIDGIPFVIKSPDFEDEHYIEDQKVFIEDYFNTVLDTLRNGGDYSGLIDEATFIDWFIVNEVFKNVDSGYSSVYFHKDKEGLLKMGPVWDFDISSGVPGYVSPEERGPTGWWTARGDKNVFFYYLMSYPSFRENLKARWNEVYDNSIEVVLQETLYAADLITQSSYNNFELWDIIGKEEEWFTSPEILAIQTYDEQVWFLYDYLKIRIEWLNTEINKF